MDQNDITGPAEVMLPGSQQFLLGMAVLLGALAVTILVVSVVLRVRRRRRDKPRRRPVGLLASAVLIVVALLVGWVNWPPQFTVPEFPPLPRLFADEAFFYRTVGDLPVAAESNANIDALGSLPLQPYAASKVSNGRVAGKPFNLVSADTPTHEVRFTLPAGSDEGSYPITDPAYIQSMPWYGIDEHYIGIDLEQRRMWEMWATRKWFGSWRAGSGAIWNLDSLQYPKGRTTASGFPMQPMTITYEQVAAGSVDHAIFVGSPVVGGAHVWPARASDGPSEDPDAPPMGTWFRLRKDVDLSALGPQAQVVARAMQTHGVILGDTGGSFSLSGTPDARWDDDDLATLKTLTTDDLEVVDTSRLMVREGSMEAVQP
ncbi:MAG: hypothetical protein GY812_09840 [Actinomycetia bacterium]|nr:hypothetical protein [Actinomycetes bacterium]